METAWERNPRECLPSSPSRSTRLAPCGEADARASEGHLGMDRNGTRDHCALQREASFTGALTATHRTVTRTVHTHRTVTRTVPPQRPTPPRQVQLHECIQPAGGMNIYLIMDFISGEDLKSAVKRRPLPDSQATEMILRLRSIVTPF